MKIPPVGAEFCHADRHDEANCGFYNFSNGPKN